VPTHTSTTVNTKRPDELTTGYDSLVTHEGVRGHRRNNATWQPLIALLLCSGIDTPRGVAGRLARDVEKDEDAEFDMAAR
jgi:hypothetical protein